MRWTLWRQAFFNAGRKRQGVRRSRVVLAPRCWRQAVREVFRPVTVTTSPLHRGEHEVSRKAIAQGMSDCLRCPVCSCAPFLRTLAHETAGAARIRHSLRPRFSREAKEFASLGRNRAAGTIFVVPANAGTHAAADVVGKLWSTTLLEQHNPVVMG